MLRLRHARSPAEVSRESHGEKLPACADRTGRLGVSSALWCAGQYLRTDGRGGGRHGNGRNGLASALLRAHGAPSARPGDTGRLDSRRAHAHARLAARLVLLALAGCGAADYSALPFEPIEASAMADRVPDAGTDPVDAGPDTGPDVADVLSNGFEAGQVADSGPDASDAEPEASSEASADPPDAGPFGYALGQIIPATQETGAPQSTCCIPETLTPPPGQVACATTFCEHNCVPVVCGTCPPVETGGAYTMVCPAP